jgi:hypothetical protein
LSEDSLDGVDKDTIEIHDRLLNESFFHMVRVWPVTEIVIRRFAIADNAWKLGI